MALQDLWRVIEMGNRSMLGGSVWYSEHEALSYAKEASTDGHRYMVVDEGNEGCVVAIYENGEELPTSEILNILFA